MHTRPCIPYVTVQRQVQHAMDNQGLTVDGWVRFLLQWLGVELVALCMPRKGVVCLQSGLEHSSSRPCPGVSLDNLWDAVQSGGLSAYVAMLSGLQWPAGLLSRVVATLGWAVECGPLPSSCRVRVAPPCCKGRCLYGFCTGSCFCCACTWPCALDVLCLTRGALLRQALSLQQGEVLTYVCLLYNLPNWHAKGWRFW
jgi:hypothetical protein